MKAPKAFWIGLVCALGGCTQLLELDQEFRPGPTGNAGSGGSSGAGGMAGAAGSAPCDVEADCLPPDNVCTGITCVTNVCVTSNLPAGTTCTADDANVCDGNGICGNCMKPSDCTTLPADDECQTRTCNNHVCGQTFTATGTLLMAQVMGDCVEAFCDGAGNTKTQAANMDLPEDDNPCTKNVCNAGAPSFPFEPLNAPCGTDGACDGDGACKNPNSAPCLTGTTCSSGNCVEGYCCDNSCSSKCRACNVPGLEGICSIVPVGYSDDTCPSPKSCDGTSGGNSCANKYPIGYPCTLASQCGSGICVDGACCSSTCSAACKSCNVAGAAGTCTNLPNGQEDGALCSGANSCDGMGVCKKDNGQTCTIATECSSANCVDGVCCSSSCAGLCKACNVAGNLGTCTNVAPGIDDAPICTGTNSCDGNGICKKDNGESCMNGNDCVSAFCIDGVCCNGACLATCQACNVTGIVGTCVNVLSGQEDLVATTACMGVNSCNGAGACLLDNGQPCTNNTQCVSNNCTGLPMTCQ